MPRSSDIVVPTKGNMKSNDRAPPRRHTYAASDKNVLDDLFAFSMHATTEFYDDVLASPTPNDMYTDDFYDDDTAHYSAIGSLPLLSLDEDQEVDANSATTSSSSSRRKSLSRSKSKKLKKRKSSKRLSSDSISSKKSTSSEGKSKTKSSKSKKSSKTPETKSVAAMLKKLEEYEETLKEERRLLQKERDEIASERETLKLKSCELESRLDELEDNGGMMSPRSRHDINDDAIRIENRILQRRLQRQDEIILQLSNLEGGSQAVVEQEKNSDEILRLEKELSQAKDLISKNEKIIKGQKLTIDRMNKESFSKSYSMIFPTKKKDDDTVATLPFEDSFSSLDDSSSSLRFSSDKKETRKSSSSKNDRIKNLIKLQRHNSSRERFRNRIMTPEEAALSHLLDPL
ncbi:unnamed protein product [Cylindrotheca closterium]|uniref:Uncharacterized protein n=1 Tax=Cylindrotheca closterium TaxID=2856 RepID=A0AAD2G535_9STRA|nr:unnamed protein product [Cylindrotheca closterium]